MNLSTKIAVASVVRAVSDVLDGEAVRVGRWEVEVSAKWSTVGLGVVAETPRPGVRYLFAIVGPLYVLASRRAS